MPDIRWLQRFQHFKMALAQLREAVELVGARPLSRLESQGAIHAFEFTHELAWNTLKDFLEDRGVAGLYGSKDATQAAYKVGLIERGEVWMDMVKSRNLTTHTYNERTASHILAEILGPYFAEFTALRDRFESLAEGDDQ